MKRSGFTLIELLVVLIILGILAAIAIPRFMAGTETARVAEATRMLGAIREAEEVIQQTTGTYTNDFNSLGANIRGGTVSANNLTITSRYWNTNVSANNATVFTATATRLNVPGNTPYSTQTITLNQNGNWGGTHSMRPVDE